MDDRTYGPSDGPMRFDDFGRFGEFGSRRHAAADDGFDPGPAPDPDQGPRSRPEPDAGYNDRDRKSVV